MSCVTDGPTDTIYIIFFTFKRTRLKELLFSGQSTWQTGVGNAMLEFSGELDLRFLTTMAVRKHKIFHQFQTKIIKVSGFRLYSTTTRKLFGR